MKTHLSIEDVAKQSGLTAYTLRYYERISLITPVGRGAGGQRRYAAKDMDWIAFLLRLRTTRMPISMMQTYARLRAEGEATIAARRCLLEEHLQNTLAEIDAMRQSAHALEEKIAHYKTIEASRQASQQRHAA